MYRIRMDQKSDLNVDEFIQSTKPQSYVLVHHVLPHGNPHYHIYLQSDLKENTLRQRIKRLGYVASDFSLKKCDIQRKDEYIQYLFNQKHGNIATLVSKHNVDDELLQRLQTQAQTVAYEFQTNRNTKRVNKPTVYDYAEEIVTRVNEDRQFRSLDSYQIKFEEYTKVAIKVLHKYRQPFEEHYLKRLVQTAITIEDGNRPDFFHYFIKKVFPERYI